MAGDIFLLGTHSWQIRRIEAGVVRVRDAGDAPPTVPFWRGEAPARTPELSEEVSRAARAGRRVPRARRSRRRARVAHARPPGIDGRRGDDDRRLHRVRPRRARRASRPLDTLVVERFFDDTGGMQLVIHSPYGGRINRAFGLALRKKFCRTFDFELQAAASDDAIVLSLGPHHSFPLDEVRALRQRAAPSRRRCSQAFLDAPMFISRWRWNLNRALLVLRFRGGRRNPPPIQRMEADDLMAAVFPQAAACQDNRVGPIEIPDHVIVRQTDRRHAARSARRRRPARAARAHREPAPSTCTRSTRPSRRCSRTRSSPRGRTRSSTTRSSRTGARTRCTSGAASRSTSPRSVASTPTPSRAVHAEITPQPETSRRPPRPALLARARCRRGRVGRRCGRSSSRRAGRRLRRARRPAAVVRDRDARRRARLLAGGDDAATITAVRGHLELAGITTVEAICAGASASTPVGSRSPLAALERRGLRAAGRVTRDDADRGAVGVAPAARTHALVLAQAPAQAGSSPRRARTSCGSCCAGSTSRPARSSRGVDGLATVISRLQGWEAAAAAWEPELVRPPAARLRRRTRLDRLCHEGDIGWLRLSPRRATSTRPPARRTSRRRSRSCSATTSTGCSTRRATALEPVRTDRRRDRRGHRACCARRGACFATELGTAPPDGCPKTSSAALWDGVSRGHPHRRRVRRDPRPASTGARRTEPTRRISRLMRAGTGPVPRRAGRWSLVPRPAPSRPIDRDELAEAVAELLLNRWGVVFGDLAMRESIRFPWRDVQRALRRLEDRGLVQGGRFVSGFSGEQFALPPRPSSSPTCASSNAPASASRSTQPTRATSSARSCRATVVAIRTRVTYVDGVPE